MLQDSTVNEQNVLGQLVKLANLYNSIATDCHHEGKEGKITDHHSGEDRKFHRC
jgi:hypothetical protein